MKSIGVGIKFGRGGLVVLAAAVAAVLLAAGGCASTNRAENRANADREAYDMIAERNLDPRWQTEDYSVEIDPRSRYFDKYNQDRPPMPEDDPASHKYMKVVAGMKGWEHWEDNGRRAELENPAWRQALGEYVDVNEAGWVKLNVDSALKLAYVHSPDHQRQLETLYLSALDVTTERFRLDTQYYGGYDARYVHDHGANSNVMSVGRGSLGNPALQASRRFAGAGELLVGFANSFVAEFSGSNTSFGGSLVGFSFVQPLMRGAGRDVALEQLTTVERALLANLRAYHQYRQGFYTDVAIGELGVSGLQRGGPSTVISVSAGQGGVGGYIGLLQQLQRKRNTEANLSLQERTLERLEAFQNIGVIDLVQVDQFRQSIEAERANLLQIHNSYELSLDYYKTGTLGLPPDLGIELDDSLIRQFQLVAPEATVLEDDIVALQDRVGALSDQFGLLRADVSVEAIAAILADCAAMVEPVRVHLESIEPDLAAMEAQVQVRERSMTDDQKAEFAEDRKRLSENLAELHQKFEAAEPELETLTSGLSQERREETVDGSVKWLRILLRVVQDSVLVQARARLETVSVEMIELDSGQAYSTALAERMDFMNGRAALVDRWRSIQISADALQSALNVTVDGDVSTTGNNAARFNGATRTLAVGVQFDTPFTRLLERNNYRQSLITYQQSRRSFIGSHDSLALGLRGLLREIEQLRVDLEIQRRAVTIAIRRVDMTRAAFYAPVRPPQPGQRPAQFGPTAATNLLTALAALRNTQNNFMGVWLNYYGARMRLDRELGIMELDEQGRWLEDSQSQEQVEDASNEEIVELPPSVPAEWVELAELVAAADEAGGEGAGKEADDVN